MSKYYSDQREYMKFLENPKKMRKFCDENFIHFEYLECKECFGTGLICDYFGETKHWRSGLYCKECNGNGGRVNVKTNDGAFFVCDTCKGTGITDKILCEKCNGMGWIDWLDNVIKK